MSWLGGGDPEEEEEEEEEEEPDQEEQEEELEWALRDHLYKFSSALKSGLPPEEIISRFFHPDKKKISIHEHGPEWAHEVLRFLGEWKGNPSASPPGTAARRRDSSSSDELEELRRAGPFGPTREEARGTVLDYMQALGSALTPTRITIEEIHYELEEWFVSCAGEAVFKANESGQAWREKFCWYVHFEQAWSGRNQTGGPKIWRWEIFADTLSAYLAVQGQHPQPL